MERLFSKALADLGFREWAYQVIRSDVPSRDKPLILTTFPESWRDHYLDQGYHRIDPVICKGPEQVLPFTWGSLTVGVEPTPVQRRFFAEAEDIGLGDGLGIPVFGARGALAMISMVAEEETQRLADMLRRRGDAVHLIALIFHTLARDLLAQERACHDPVGLTPRERECLLWLVNGKTRWEAASILGVSPETVKFHLKNIRAKLGVYSREELIVQALRLGIVDP